jgi:tetratricopeptide (TPR) repeat protein
MTVAQVTVDWAAAAAEVDRVARANPHAALDLVTDWLDREQAAANAEGYARAQLAHARTLYYLGSYDSAIAAYEDAAAQFRALGLEIEAARTQVGQIAAMRYTGQYEEAIKLGSSLRAYFVQIGDDLQIAKLANNLGTIHRPMGQLTSALRLYREALALFRRLGEQASTADLEQNVGNVLGDLGRYEEALGHLRTAERIRRRLGLRSQVAHVLLYIGIVSRKRGDYGRALQVLTEAGQIYDSLGVGHGNCIVDIEMLRTCVALNLRDEARDAAGRAIDGLRKLAMPLELGQTLLAAGSIAELDGESDQARAYIDEAREIFARLGNRIWESLARLQGAQLVLNTLAHRRQNDVPDEPDRPEPGPDESPALGGAGEPEARTLTWALTECQEATQQLSKAGALDHAAFGRLVEATILTELAASGHASTTMVLARYHAVLEAAEELHADHLLYQVHTAIGRLLETDDPDTAADYYRRAITHLEAVRARAVADDLKLSFLADKIDIYERIVDVLISRGSEEALAEAYSFVDRSKSRTLLEGLLEDAPPARGGRRSRVARLNQQARVLRTRLHAAYTVAYGQDAVPSSDSMSRSGNATMIAELELELAQTNRALQLAMRDEHARSGAVTSVEPCPGLPADVAMVEYYAVGQELLAFVDAGDGLRLHRLGDLADVERTLERLNFQMGKMSLGPEYIAQHLEKLRSGSERVLQQLYRALLEPLESDLAGRSRVLIVPHGPLHGIPFHAFYDGEQYVIDRLTIAYAPSAGVYHACSKRDIAAANRTVVVGLDDPGLPWIEREVQTVAAVWPDAVLLQGKKATARALHRHAGRIDTLHLATHGVFRADNPAFSSIKLQDAWLTVSDLAELARGARLVTLSACETGVTGLAAGDEILGLTRGILAAGCRTVVASLWTVADESTAHLMEQFYDHIRDGAEPAIALQAAMRTLRAAYDHPYYWAAFVAVGGGFEVSSA